MTVDKLPRRKSTPMLTNIFDSYKSATFVSINMGITLPFYRDWQVGELIHYNTKEVKNIAQNEGKKFESDVKASIPNTCWFYRLRDNASSFAGGQNTRFTSSNICDCLIFDDNTKTLFLVECKSTKGTSIPLTMIRDNQIRGLKEASEHRLVAGMLINFRNENNDTFFLLIDEYLDMMESLNKKSFNIKDLESIGATRVECEKKRTRYKYNIAKMISELHL